MKIKPKIGLVARPGTHSAGERTEIHVSGLDVKPHLVGVGKGFPTLWALFMLVLLMHVEDVAPKGLLTSQHPVIAKKKRGVSVLFCLLRYLATLNLPTFHKFCTHEGLFAQGDSS